jgi:hypothetical protein
MLRFLNHHQLGRKRPPFVYYGLANDDDDDDDDDDDKSIEQSPS